MHYLDELNEPQKAAAKNIGGPMMVIAGAGSGKTRVLTYRIAHMIDQGIDAFNILSLTFTNKAAKEMKERISKMLGDGQARNVWSGTFHSVLQEYCVRRVNESVILVILPSTIHKTLEA